MLAGRTGFLTNNSLGIISSLKLVYPRGLDPSWLRWENAYPTKPGSYMNSQWMKFLEIDYHHDTYIIFSNLKLCIKSHVQTVTMCLTGFVCFQPMMSQSNMQCIMGHTNSYVNMGKWLVSARYIFYSCGYSWLVGSEKNTYISSSKNFIYNYVFRRKVRLISRSAAQLWIWYI